MSLRDLLTFDVREQGLRVAILRVFSPLSRPFLVPWRDIAVSRRRGVFGPVVALRFGDRGTLTLAADVADRLARAPGPRWPETEPVPPALRGRLGLRLVREWVLVTAVAAAFFTIVAGLVAPPEGRLPIRVAGLVLAVVVAGIGALIQFWRQRER